MMRIYTGSDADLILRPFMVKLDEIKSVKLDIYTDDKYSVVKTSGVTIDTENSTVTAHLTSDETVYFNAGVLNVQMSYSKSDEAYPDGTYDGIVTIPQEYYVVKSSDTSGKSLEDVYESGFTAGEEFATANSVRSLNGQKGELTLKTVNGNDLLGEGDIKIEGGSAGGSGKAVTLNNLTQDEYKAIREKCYNEIKASGHTEDTYYYNNGTTSILFNKVNYLANDDVLDFVEFFGIDETAHSYRGVISNSNEFQMYDEGKKLGINDIDLQDNLFGTVSVQSHMAGDESDKDIEYYTTQYFIFYGSMYGTSFSFYIRNGFGDDTQTVTINANSKVAKDGTVQLVFIYDNYNYIYQLGQWHERNGKMSFVSKTAIGGGSSSAVTSVNGKTGDVTLDIPTKTSQLTNDSNYVASSSISNIVVLTQTEYDALTRKDDKTLYCIKN